MLTKTRIYIDYLQTTPNVLLWSAATAACAQPGMYAPVALMAKDMDGSIVPLLPSNAAMSWSPSKTVHYSLPMDRLSQLFNVNHFIVSQVSSLGCFPIQSSPLPSWMCFQILIV